MIPERERKMLFNKSRDQRWFTHGPLELQFTPIVCKRKQIIFLARVPSREFPSYLTITNLALILSLDEKVSKTLPEISEEYNKWIDRINEDFSISFRSYKQLSRSILYANINEIQNNLGFNIIKKDAGSSWRLT